MNTRQRKEVKKLERHITNKETQNNLNNAKSQVEFENALIKKSKDNYYSELNYLTKIGGSSSSIGSALLNKCIIDFENILLEYAEELFNNFIVKKHKNISSSSIATFLLRNSVLLNESETAVCPDSVRNYSYIIVNKIINHILSQYNFDEDGANLGKTEIYKLYDSIGKGLIEEQIFNVITICEPWLVKSLENRNLKVLNAAWTRKKVKEIAKNNENINYINFNGKDKYNNQVLLIDDEINDISKIGAIMTRLCVDSCDIFDLKNQYLTIKDEIIQDILKKNNILSTIKPKSYPMPSKFGKPIKWTSLTKGGYVNIKNNFVKANKKALKELDEESYKKSMEVANILQETEYQINNTVYSTIKLMMNEDQDFKNKKGELILPKCIEDKWSFLTKKSDDLVKFENEEFKPWIDSVFEYKNRQKSKGVKKLSLPKKYTIESQSKKFQIKAEELKNFKIKHMRESEFVASNNSKYISLKMNMEIAALMGLDGFYLPCNIDYRNRFYYLTSLNPQSTDYIKAMLNFKEKKEIKSDDALFWTFNCMANDYGLDKASPIEKYSFIKENIYKMSEAAKNPLEHIEFWGNADKPFMFLNACSTMLDYVNHPENKFITNYICFFDGTNNGTQHLGAMTGDYEACYSTNLTSEKTRQDLYQRVADRTSRIISEINDNQIEDEYIFEDKDGDQFSIALKEKDYLHCQDILNFGVSRKLAKQPTMTKVYAAVSAGRRNQIEGVFLDVLRNGGDLPFNAETLGFKVSLLERTMNSCISAEQKQVTKFMDWLQQVAGVFSRVLIRNEETNIVEQQGLNIQWTNPMGARINQRYIKSETSDVSVYLGKKKIRVYYQVETNNISKSRNNFGIVANFVHSYDAGHMGLTILRCKELNINNFACVHDSFGVAAADSHLLYSAVRETFYDIYSNKDLINELYTDFYNQVAIHDKELADEIVKPDFKSNYDIKEVLNSVYAFI